MTRNLGVVRAFAVLTIGLACVACAGCAAGSGDPAVWELRETPTPESTIVEVAATRLACASGVTGELREPVVTYDADEVIITISAVPLGGDSDTCPSNDYVPVSVELTEPLGSRSLVDGTCRTTDARTTTFCTTDVRWSP